MKTKEKGSGKHQRNILFICVCVCVCVFTLHGIRNGKQNGVEKKEKRREKEKIWKLLFVGFFLSICRWIILDLNVFITGSPRKGGTGFYWVLIGYTGLDKVVMGFTGFYWTLPSLTEFSWV